MAPNTEENRYKRILEHIFFDPDFGDYSPGKAEIAFERDAIVSTAAKLGIPLPKSHLQNSTPIMREILSDVTTLDRICVIAPDFHPPRQRATVFGRDGQMGSVLARRFTGKVSELPLKCR